MHICIYAYACMLGRFRHVRLFATLWTVACQVPLSMGFSRQEYQSGLPCPLPGDFADPGIKPAFPMTLELQADSLLLCHRGSPIVYLMYSLFYTYLLSHMVTDFFGESWMCYSLLSLTYCLNLVSVCYAIYGWSKFTELFSLQPFFYNVYIYFMLYLLNIAFFILIYPM